MTTRKAYRADIYTCKESITSILDEDGLFNVGFARVSPNCTRVEVRLPDGTLKRAEIRPDTSEGGP